MKGAFLARMQTVDCVHVATEHFEERPETGPKCIFLRKKHTKTLLEVFWFFQFVAKSFLK